MAEHRKPDQGTPNPGYEVRDVDVRRLVIYAVVLVVVIVISLGVTRLTFDYFARREAASQSPPSTLASNARDQLPPEPRLQQNPLADLRRLRAEEADLLDSYGWVDQPKGIVRIPVEEAMKLTVRQGLPHRDKPDVIPPAPVDGRRR